jgi:hypothetical protein
MHSVSSGERTRRRLNRLEQSSGVARWRRVIYNRGVTKSFVSRIVWKDEPQQVIALYAKMKDLLCLYS